MVAAVYLELAATSLALIAEFGRDVSYRPRGTADLASGEPWRGNALAAASTIKAAIFDATAKDRATFPGTTFDKRALVAPASLTDAPRPGDIVTDGEIPYRVSRVVTYGPGDADVLYALLLTTAAP